MKFIVICSLLLVPLSASASDWLKAAGDALNSPQEEASTALDFSKGLGSAISEGLGVSSTQSKGGLGSLFSLAQSTLGSEQFSSLASAVPGMGDLLKAAPALEGGASSLGGLTGGLGDYAEAVKGAGSVYSQFQALGLDAAAVPKYIDITTQYLQSTGGQKAASLFTKGIASLL